MVRRCILFTAAVATLQSAGGLAVADPTPGGCSAFCDEGSQELIVEGVADLILASGESSIALAVETEKADRSLTAAIDQITADVGMADLALGRKLDTLNATASNKFTPLLYETIRDRINAARLLLSEERNRINEQIACGTHGLVWSRVDQQCISPNVPTCGALKIHHFDGRTKSIAECSGIIGTECETHCEAGWSGENITYFCTGTNDKNDGWQRIAAHGKREQTCFNVDECSYPDYPCNDKTYRCTDSEGSFSCRCDSTMVESAEKVSVWPDGAPNGFGKKCECPDDSWWMFASDEHPPVPFCVCPYGGDTPMVYNAGEQKCMCPANALAAQNVACPGGDHLDGPSQGKLTGVLNPTDENKCVYCKYPKDCQEAADNGAITADEQEVYVRSPTAPTGIENKITAALCLRMTTDGGTYGQTEERVLTHIKCGQLLWDDFDTTTSSFDDGCSEMQSTDVEDTCNEYGYIRQPFRSKEHYQKLYAAYGLDMVGVLGPWDSNWNYVGYTDVPISSVFQKYFKGSSHGVYHPEGWAASDLHMGDSEWCCNDGYWWWQYNYESNDPDNWCGSYWGNLQWDNGNWQGWWQACMPPQAPMVSTPNSNQNSVGWRSVDDGPWWLFDHTDHSMIGGNRNAASNLMITWSDWAFDASWWDQNFAWGMLRYEGYGRSWDEAAPADWSWSTPWTGSSYVCGAEHSNPSGDRP
jgi:hypothetical protein